ncbi:BrnA antitoxin family protein [Bdellovibrio bacteriovorus]|uniref:BrnA antitoxin family protein n=1 Tax=Bdellovibrio TaxID=958 RepID=UPI0035A8FE91
MAKVKTHKTKINYGSVEIEEGVLSSQNVKIRTTAMIDGDVLVALKERAAKENTKYQTLMNKILREAVLGIEPSYIDEIERALLKRGFIKKGK